MNTETGEVREFKPGELIDKKLWTEISHEEADLISLIGPSGIKAMAPDPRLSSRGFRRKYGCSRMEYGLRAAMQKKVNERAP